MVMEWLWLWFDAEWLWNGYGYGLTQNVFLEYIDQFLSKAHMV